jgi:hypothetical protein
MYVIFECYYNYGERDVTVISNDEEMRTYCLDELSRYDVSINYGDKTLEELIKLTVYYGNIHIDNRGCWGVTAIVYGDQLEVVGVDNA